MDANQMLFYETLRCTIGPIIKMRLRLKIEGQQNVPDFGPALIVCNHRSSLDPVILAYAVRNRYINYGAASWSWKIPGYAQLHEWTGAFPITLTGGKDAKAELNRGLELLKNDEVVGIFPEGGDTILDPGKADKIKHFKTGFARMALEARVPIIPCAVIGIAERRMPTIPGPLVEKLIKHPKAGQGYSSVMYKRAACRIGAPLDLGDLRDKPVNKQLLDLISNKVRQIVMKLYNGEDLDRFMTGETPFDFAYERVGSGTKKLL
jgi:1-acyl-sn-glycerol-3-phosphate acyltransferase